MTTRVALYTRVSTDLQANREEGSLETQEARLRKYIESRQGEHVVAAVFREEGASGKSLDRPALKQLLRAVRNREVDLILVTRVDRLSRSLLDFFEVHKLFEDHEVTFISLNESFDTSSPLGRAMLKLVLVFAELEREQTAERTRSAMRARAERGLWNGGPPLLGYDPVGSGHLEVNEEEAVLVRLIFDRYQELRSAPKLARWLNEQGYRQKRFESRRRGLTGGGTFNPSNIRNMLRNRTYIGQIVHKGEAFEGQHDAIVDAETFEHVQSILDGNAKKRRAPQPTAKHDYPLVGLVRCECGYALSTHSVRKKDFRYHYYQCIGEHKVVGHTCEVKRVRAEALEAAVLGLIEEAARDPEIIAQATADANALAVEYVQPLRERAATLQRELVAAQAEGKQLLRNLLLRDLGDSGMAREMLREAETRVEDLEASLVEVEAELAAREMEYLEAQYIQDAVQGFHAAYEHLDAGEKRELLGLMIDEIIVHPGSIEVGFFDGRRAVGEVVAPRRRRRRKPGNRPEDDDTRHDSGEFVPGVEWLPLLDSNQRHVD